MARRDRLPSYPRCSMKRREVRSHGGCESWYNPDGWSIRGNPNRCIAPLWGPRLAACHSTRASGRERGYSVPPHTSPRQCPRLARPGRTWSETFSDNLEWTRMEKQYRVINPKSSVIKLFQLSPFHMKSGSCVRKDSSAGRKNVFLTTIVRRGEKISFFFWQMKVGRNSY